MAPGESSPFCFIDSCPCDRNVIIGLICNFLLQLKDQLKEKTILGEVLWVKSRCKRVYVTGKSEVRDKRGSGLTARNSTGKSKGGRTSMTMGSESTIRESEDFYLGIHCSNHTPIIPHINLPVISPSWRRTWTDWKNGLLFFWMGVIKNHQVSGMLPN